MAEFEADKTSGTGPALVMVHPLKVNDTEADKKAILTITAVSYTHLTLPTICSV